MDDNTKRDRIFTFVRGANSFVSGEALSDNPYDRGPDFGDPKAWIAGWRYAEQSDDKQFSELDYGHLEQLAKRLIEKKYDRPFFLCLTIYTVVAWFVAFYLDYPFEPSLFLFVSPLIPVFLRAWILAWLFNNRAVEVWLRLYEKN